ncbi:MAG: UDP-N-acetylenolpyruvoylglucosamine reductase, partial [Proteobacteria bacterium]|nr:UDP-N-acetylenolpyruvoylglucosamine reductase [Pseudomonadota bacterium]
QDILDLIEIVKKTVKNQSGISLECEVIILGG